MDVILIGVLSSSLWRNIHHGTFQKFEQTLLDTFAAYVACDAWVVRFACNLVYFIYEDNASFGSFYIIVGHLKQTA